MRLRDAVRGRIASTAAQVVLVAAGALVGWLLFGLFAGPAQAAPPEEEASAADSGGLLGLVPLPPVLEDPDPADLDEPVEQVTESAEPVTRLVEQTTTTVVEPVTEVLADAPMVRPLVEAVPASIGQVVEARVTDAGLPAVLSLTPAVEPVTAAEPLLTLRAVAVDRTSIAGASPPPPARAGAPPAWWPGLPLGHSHPPGAALASPIRAGPAPDRFPDRPLPRPIPGSGTYQLVGSPTDPGHPLAWTGPATVEPSADPVRPRISADVAGSGLALPVFSPPG